MDERAVKAKPALAIALVSAQPVESAVPIARTATRTGDVSSLIVPIVDRVDMKTLARTTDAGVVASRTVTTVDVNRAILGTQRFEVLLAQRLKAVVVTALYLRAIVAIELLHDEVLT